MKPSRPGSGWHESPATLRAYRKEAERLIVWAVLERGKAMTSSTTEDATAYRAFLRRPAPVARWTGPLRPRSSPEWRPFAGALSADSVAYAVSVTGAMFRWLVEQRYTLANPFAGMKVRGAKASRSIEVGLDPGIERVRPERHQPEARQARPCEGSSGDLRKRALWGRRFRAREEARPLFRQARAPAEQERQGHRSEPAA